jgi:hypothetical protein
LVHHWGNNQLVWFNLTNSFWVGILKSDVFVLSVFRKNTSIASENAFAVQL